MLHVRGVGDLEDLLAAEGEQFYSTYAESVALRVQRAGK